MKVTLVTTNKFKAQEAKEILAPYPVELEYLNMEYEENHEAGLAGIASSAAAKLAKELKRPVLVEDTGIFFAAYTNFPGTRTKYAWQALGYRGLFKLLAGESRQAYFETVVGFGRPRHRVKLFAGRMEGRIAEQVFNQHLDVMPYDRIFIPAGYGVTISHLSLAEKNQFSQRSQALMKFGEYLKNS